MQRMMKTCEEYDCWFLLLDTNSSVALIHPPPGKDADSYRLEAEMSPLPIWPFLDFDVWVDEEFKHSKPTPRGALHIEHQSIYGRPVGVKLTEVANDL